VKRADLVREILKTGCTMIRHGARHDWCQNPRTRACQPIPRHREIAEGLARQILKKLRD